MLRRIPFIALLVFGIGVHGCSPKPLPVDQATVFEVMKWEPEPDIWKASLSAESEPFAEVLEYFKSPNAFDGTISFVHYVPGTVIKTDTIRINFTRGRTTVVSTRASKADTWYQVSRTSTPADARIERALKKYLEEFGVPLP